MRHRKHPVADKNKSHVNDEAVPVPKDKHAHAKQIAVHQDYHAPYMYTSAALAGNDLWFIKRHGQGWQQKNQAHQMGIKKVAIDIVRIKIARFHPEIIQRQQEQAHTESHPGRNLDPVYTFDVFVLNKFPFQVRRNTLPKLNRLQ